MTDYDRRTASRPKTAAKMDLHSKWRDIVDKHRIAESKEMERLLKSCAAPLKKAGFDLDMKKSYLDKYHSGSDGTRMEGALFISQRSSDDVWLTKGEVEMLLRETLEVYGSAQGSSDGSWEVDLTES